MPKNNQQKNIPRIHFIDEVRGFAVILMVAYHAFYTVGYIFGLELGRFLFVFFTPAEAFFAGVFIFICGISCRLSRNNLKRGALLLLVALAITLILNVVLPDEIILFGILHFLAVSILLFVPLRRLLNCIHPIAGIVACAALLLVTWWVPEYKGGFFGIKGLFSWPVPDTLKQPWLFPFGFGELQSADYFPILPWIFCFLGGSFVGVWAARRQLPAWMYRSRVPFLSVIGRHALIIYIVHQPVIYALCYIVSKIIQ